MNEELEGIISTFIYEACKSGEMTDEFLETMVGFMREELSNSGVPENLYLLTVGAAFTEIHNHLEKGIIKREGDRYVWVEPDEIVKNRNA